MAAGGELPRLSPDDFARRFQLRAGNVAWLLGAGASASAGVPTAYDMIWDFKQRLFVSQRRVSPASVADLSNRAVRRDLQDHIDASGSLPGEGADDEYAALFEAVYPAEADRRAYIDAKLAGSSPSYGHIALATLMRAGLLRIVWTTNFDTLVADACARVYGTTGSLATVALDAPDQARDLIAAERWPVEVKLHGDFRSRRLKNTSDELREQDEALRRMLVESSNRLGLVVAGYSGRDESVMSALEAALDGDTPFPTGLFWLHRGDTPPLPRVAQLLNAARAKDVEAALVQVENFDEALRDLLRLIDDDVDKTEVEAFATDRRRMTPPPRVGGKRGWPIVRFNALEVTESPTTCRRIVCAVGGIRECRDAIETAGVSAIVTRTRGGVLAFGSDRDLRRAFNEHAITEFDLHAFEIRRFRYDSMERGLLKEALLRALAASLDLEVLNLRRGMLAPRDPDAAKWAELKGLVGAVSGTVSGVSNLRWREGVAVRLDWADDRLWLLSESRTLFDGLDATNKSAAADFARERSVGRYNRKLNDLIAYWARMLAADREELRALGIGDGVDAVFRLEEHTAFSWRARA